MYHLLEKSGKAMSRDAGHKRQHSLAETVIGTLGANCVPLDPGTHHHIATRESAMAGYVNSTPRFKERRRKKNPTA